MEVGCQRYRYSYGYKATVRLIVSRLFRIK